MNTKAHFISLSEELKAVKDRVQNLIGERHWPTVGAWKESALRAVIRRYLPSQLQIGTGFIMTKAGLSSQIDILIYDDSGPILFRDGDLVIVTPDVVRAIIEVKTNINRRDLKKYLAKLDKVLTLLASSPGSYTHKFFGVFAYEDSDITPDFLLKTLKLVNGRRDKFVINCIAIGTRQFVRYWQYPPTGMKRNYAHWHCYNLNEIAQAYFVHNVVDHLFPETVFYNDAMWYPVDGKESYLADKISRYFESD